MKNTSKKQLRNLSQLCLADLTTTSYVVDYYIAYCEERDIVANVRKFTDNLTTLKMQYENGENKMKIKARLYEMINTI